MEQEQQQSVYFESFIQQEQYHEKLLKFPPFYTIQDHVETRKKQLINWGNITQNYFKKNKIQNSSLSELSSDEFPLFQDKSSGTTKRLNKQEIQLILDQLETLEAIEWKGNTKENFTVNWFSSYELADCIYKWAKNNKFIGDIETLKFIQSGNQTDKTEKFYNLPDEQILKALYVLQEQGKGQVYEIDNLYSFKFQ